jgi:PAP2 superfamily
MAAAMPAGESYFALRGPKFGLTWKAAPEDLWSAAALLSLVTLYGAVMEAVSHAPFGELAVHIANFAALSFYSGLLVAAAFALFCLGRPTAQTELGSRAFWLVVACLLTTLIFPFFAMFKELVLPTRGFRWDHTFAHIGRAIFGRSPWTITHHLFGGLLGTRVLDLAYRSLLPLMFGLPLVSAVLVTDARMRFRILLTWTMSWIVIGSLGGWYFASAGPCYYNTFIAHDPDYAELLRRLAELGRQASAQRHPIASLGYQSGLLSTYRTHDFAPGGGISAMPSMHVAMMTLVAIVAWSANRWMGAIFAIFALVVWLATIHFGWHYFVDGPVGASMMIGLWILAKPMAARVYSDRLAQRLPVAIPKTVVEG